MWPQPPPPPQSTATSGPGSCYLFVLRRDGRIKRCAIGCRRRSKSFLPELRNIIANPRRGIVSAKKQCVLGFTAAGGWRGMRAPVCHAQHFGFQESARGGKSNSMDMAGREGIGGNSRWKEEPLPVPQDAGLPSNRWVGVSCESASAEDPREPTR